MGGLGVMLTALSIAQSESPFLSVSVVLPFYSFLHTDFPGQISHFAEIPIHIAGVRGRKPKIVGCVVSKLKWEYESVVDFLNPELEGKQGKEKRSIDIYLIGPGDQSPFNVAFRAKDAGDVYTAYKPLKQEWKDLWFAKAAAGLLDLLDEDVPMPSHEVPDLAPTGVDVVHLHGATNAMVGYYLRHTEEVEGIDREFTPAIVYTLHDSLDEVEYSNLLVNSLHFLDSHDEIPDFLDFLSPYLVQKQVFTSALGIDVADAVTFVSESIAADIVEGRFQFALRDLVMPSISKRASRGTFFGITNGLDFTDSTKNPFTATSLLLNKLAFPRVGANVTDLSTFWSTPFSSYSEYDDLDEDEEEEEEVRVETPISFANTKQLAKQHLIENLHSHFNFNTADATRPFLLFIGRFQYNKGCQFFEPILQLISSSPEHDARLILMGARNNYPHAALRKLALKYPDHLTLIDTVEEQKEWGTIIRMASDFSLVPSFSEAFGLVAAEGMLFGMPVISTSVGGLSEFLIPIEHMKYGGNAYTFNLFGREGQGGEDLGVSAENSRVGMDQLREAIEGCEIAVERAISDWRVRMDGEQTEWVDKEMFVRGLVADALKLKWSREKGPIEEYVRVYDLALSARRGPASTHFPTDGSPLQIEKLDLPKLLDHGVAAPSIEHGGHDDVTGEKGLEALERPGVLPVYKVWSWKDEAGAKRKAEKVSQERKALKKERLEKEKAKSRGKVIR
ncbi:hypothetical protein P7C70_g4172, partial [Phenoliferia sp. Uapishka_3]